MTMLMGEEKLPISEPFARLHGEMANGKKAATNSSNWKSPNVSGPDSDFRPARARVGVS